MPKLWQETIEAHRRQVRDTILGTTAQLVAEHGLRAVTMSQIAQDTGIGRATLYKYFSGVDEILQAWHQHRITEHLEQLREISSRPGGARDRLEAVLLAYGRMRRQRGQHHRQQLHGEPLASLLHRDDQVAPAEQQLRDLIRDLLVEATRAGDVRDDISPDELVAYCLHALDAAHSLESEAALQRLLNLVLAGLQPD
jgi:AcrR family transcriptional regulator